MTEATSIDRELKALFAEIRLAGESGDEPRYERAASALYIIYYITIEQPRTAKAQYVFRFPRAYRPTDSERQTALDLIAKLVAARENKP